MVMYPTRTLRLCSVLQVLVGREVVHHDGAAFAQQWAHHSEPVSRIRHMVEYRADEDHVKATITHLRRFLQLQQQRNQVGASCGDACLHLLDHGLRRIQARDSLHLGRNLARCHTWTTPKVQNVALGERFAQKGCHRGLEVLRDLVCHARHHWVRVEPIRDAAKVVRASVGRRRALCVVV